MTRLDFKFPENLFGPALKAFKWRLSDFLPFFPEHQSWSLDEVSLSFICQMCRLGQKNQKTHKFLLDEIAN